MFRLVASKTATAVRVPLVRRAMSSILPAGMPSAKDVLIDLTFVDPSGARRKAKGIIGT
jgi:hypothetical protein